MKILMFSFDKTILDTDSEAHRRMFEYANQLEKLYVILLCFKRGEFRAKNVNIIGFSGNKFFRLYKAYKTAKKIVKENDISLVTSQEPFESGLIAYFVSKIKNNVKCEVQLHGDFYGNSYWRDLSVVNRLRALIGLWVMRRAHGIRVVSRRIKDSLIEHGLDNKKISMISVFSPVFEVKKDNVEKIKRKYKDEFIILCVARLTREKGVEMLARAMPYIRGSIANAKLVIAGDGPEYPNILANARSLGVCEHIDFVGHVNNIGAFYKAADVLVVPSHTEGWGRVAIEAMSFGKAVIMTDVGLAGEVLHSGINGIVVPKGRVKLLAEAVISIHKNIGLRKKIEESAKQTHNQMPSKQDLIDATINCWHRIASKI